MGDKPANPADKTYRDAPQGLRDFLNCTADSFALTDGEARWIPGWPVLHIIPGNGSSTAIIVLDVTFNSDGVGVGLTIADGKLSVSMGNLAKDPTLTDTARWFRSFVENANAWLLANGKQFGPLQVTDGQAAFTKRDIRKPSQQPQASATPTAGSGPAQVPPPATKPTDGAKPGDGTKPADRAGAGGAKHGAPKAAQPTSDGAGDPPALKPADRVDPPALPPSEYGPDQPKPVKGPVVMANPDPGILDGSVVPVDFPMGGPGLAPPPGPLPPAAPPTPDKPANPADSLPKDAPQDLRDFLSCTGDRVTIKDGKAPWIGRKDAELRIVQPDLDSYNQDPSLQISSGVFSINVPVSVQGGQLAFDTSKIPGYVSDSAVDNLKALTDGANAWFKANGKQFAPLTYGIGELTLSKIPYIEPPATTERSDGGIMVGGSVILPPPLPPASVVAPPDSQPRPLFNPPPPEDGPAVQPRGSTGPRATDVLKQVATKGFIALVVVALVGGLAGGILAGNLGLVGSANPTHRPGGILESPTPEATGEPGATGPETSAEASPGATPEPAITPAPSAGLDLSKINWAILLQAGSDQVDFHCRILVRADVRFQALGSSPEEDQALVDWAVGKTAIVDMSGPGLPHEIQFPIKVQGDTYGIFGDISVATSGATYKETLVSVGGIPLNLPSQTFVNPCTQ